MNDLQIISSLEHTDISNWDFTRLRVEFQSGLDTYAKIVYTDDSIKDAKNDRAALNKVKKMIERQRIMIDDTVKDYETRQREAKESEVRKYYDRKAVILGDFAEALCSKLFDKVWVNAPTGRAKYEEEGNMAVSISAKSGTHKQRNSQSRIHLLNWLLSASM